MVDNEISEKRIEREDEKWFPDRKGLTIFKDKNLKKFCDRNSLIQQYYLQKLDEGYYHENILQFFDQNVLEDYLNQKLLKIEKTNIGKEDDTIIELQTKNIKSIQI